MNHILHSPNKPKNTGFVRFEIESQIARVTFSNTSAKNAMTPSMYEELARICQSLKKDTHIKAVIFRGAGGQAFVSGSDISQFEEFKSADDGIHYEQRISETLSHLTNIAQPTIAVIDELAVGGGLLMACACDFRISNDKARFGVPVARTLGNCLSAESTAWLLHHLGTNMLKRMLLLAELVPANELLANGFLLKTCAADELDQLATDTAKRLVNLAPITQSVAKQTIHRIISSNLPNTDDLIALCYGSQDFKNAVAAFLRGEKAVWSGS